MSSGQAVTEAEVRQLEDEAVADEPGLFVLEVWQGDRALRVQKLSMRDPFHRTTIGVERGWKSTLGAMWAALRGRLEWQIFVDAKSRITQEAVMSLDEDTQPYFLDEEHAMQTAQLLEDAALRCRVAADRAAARRWAGR